MIDYALLLNRLRNFSALHDVIKTFTSGPEKNMDRVKFNDYPIMHVVYAGSQYTDNTKTYDLTVYFLELPLEHATQQQQEHMVSNMEHAAEDLIGEIATGNLFDLDTNQFAANTGIVLESASTQVVTESKSNNMCGVSLSLQLSVPAPYDSCNIPYTT